ncbi:MAG: response regulator transcription factor [Chloroflexota bacterium]|nr:response regulator transcription factor [Dehalococcoidia bacterium]MDW8252961.1 response regulator transcription factor [Chloroflexota bacterium]
MRLVLVDDHQLVRAGLAGLFREQKAFDVVGEASNCAEAIAKIRQARPDIVLLDLRLADCDSLDLLRQIRREFPAVRVVVLSDEIDDDQLVAVLVAGASGYIPKSTEFAALVKSLHGVAAGEVALSRALTTRLTLKLQQLQSVKTGSPPPPRPPDPLLERLSERERVILAYLAKGAANKEIARSLHISEHTVRTHVTNLLSKLGFTNRVQAAAFAVQNDCTLPETLRGT